MFQIINWSTIKNRLQNILICSHCHVPDKIFTHVKPLHIRWPLEEDSISPFDHMATNSRTRHRFFLIIFQKNSKRFMRAWYGWIVTPFYVPVFSSATSWSVTWRRPSHCCFPKAFICRVGWLPYIWKIRYCPNAFRPHTEICGMGFWI